jgi:hypothetical protein
VAAYMGSKIEREGARDTTRFREIVLNQKAWILKSVIL